jgi:quercetin dioxygenase-like cupin family protein
MQKKYFGGVIPRGILFRVSEQESDSMIETVLSPAVATRTLNNTVSFGTANITFLLTASETGGNFSLMESVMRPGTEPPYHIHEREDETFYILEGHVSVIADRVVHECRQGQAIFLPRGIPHTFRVRSEVARALVHVTPSGFEKYFQSLGTPAISFDPPSGSRPADYLEVAGRAAAAHGVRLSACQPEF